MLKAKKSVWYEKIFSIYNRNLLKRRFDSFHIKNFELLQNRDISKPLIIYANHSSWWDGLVLFEILKNNDFESYVLMEEKQLVNLQFFRRLGAFSINREKSIEALKSLKYAIEILQRGENKTLLIFPQGKIFPNDIRPIKFYNGLAYITQNLYECTLIPCSIRYEFLGNFKPEIFVSFGDLQKVTCKNKISKKSFTNTLEEKMTENLDLLKNDIIKMDFNAFQKLF